MADALRANILFSVSPLAIVELQQAWNQRSRQDGYFDHASEHLVAAAKRIEQRTRAEAGKPIEKLIFTETGPVRVLMDPKTGQARPVEVE